MNFKTKLFLTSLQQNISRCCLWYEASRDAVFILAKYRALNNFTRQKNKITHLQKQNILST